MEEGDLSPENLKKIATELDVPEADVVSMNRRLASPDHSLNAPLRADMVALDPQEIRVLASWVAGEGEEG